MGHGEWMLPDRPCLAVQADHPMASIRISTGTEVGPPITVAPVNPGEPVFLELQRLRSARIGTCQRI